MPDLNQCGQCYHAFVLAKDVDQQLRIKKEIEAHRHQMSTTRLRRLVSLLFAGGGQLINGATLRGILFLVLFCSSLVALLGALEVLPVIVTLPDPDVGGVTVVVSITLTLSLA